MEKSKAKTEDLLALVNSGFLWEKRWTCGTLPTSSPRPNPNKEWKKYGI
jgi:hypothetical protein